MKAKVCGAKMAEFAMKVDGYRVNKTSQGSNVVVGETEMQECFHKLMDLVPSIPQNKKVSKVQLLQHVIDYILDLELTLEFHPNMKPCPPELISALAAVAERRPLGESSQLNTQTSHLEASSLHACSSRPASC